MAAALPLEDTPDVAAAKEAFATVYKSVEAGDHINLRPVNNDVQAKQIPNMYLDDTADVTAAKEAFMAEFRSVEAGGLMAKQAPAPVAAMPKVAEVAPVQVYSHLAHYPMYYNNMLYHHNIVPAQVQYSIKYFHLPKNITTAVCFAEAGSLNSWQSGPMPSQKRKKVI